MPPRSSGNSKIRNVESGDIEARPRDAALRKSANERAAAFIRQVETERSENQVNAYPTVSQDFNQYAEERTIQPTTQSNSTAVRGTNTQYRSNVSTSQTRNVQTQVKASSNTATRPKKKASLKRLLRPRIPILNVSATKFARASTLSISNISWGLGLWMSIQLPLAVISLVLFGVTYMVHDALPSMVRGVTGDLLYEGLSYAFSSVSDGVNWLLERILGFRLDELLNPESYFMVTHMVVFIIGLATLMLMGIIYQISLINCVFGKHSALKIATLIFAVFAYMVPLLNLIPWFLFWVIVVWRYPE